MTDRHTEKSDEKIDETQIVMLQSPLCTLSEATQRLYTVP